LVAAELYTTPLYAKTYSIGIEWVYRPSEAEHHTMITGGVSRGHSFAARFLGGLFWFPADQFLTDHGKKKIAT
jgi:hypothetical protein